MCLQHPCYESLNRFAASKPARIGYGILLVIIVAFGCFRLLQASNDLHATKNAKFIVIPHPEKNLIRYDSRDQKSLDSVVSQIERARDLYKMENPNLVKCKDQLPPFGKACDFDWDDLRQCGTDGYGYDKKRPCIYFKLKKILDWMPMFVNSSNPPADMPDHLKYMIGGNDQRGIWMWCKGQNPVDAENIGPLNYFPGFYYPFYYFPWKGQKDYIEPIVAVQFEKPMSGVVISVVCTLWTQDQKDSITFDLLID